MAKDFQEVVLLKEGQRYIFRFDAQGRQPLLGVLGRYAASPELNFSWHDAAAVCKRVRQLEAVAQFAPPAGDASLRAR